MNSASALWRNGISCATLLILTVAGFQHVERARGQRGDDLIAAAERGDAGKVSRLLACGAKPDVRRERGHDTPLLLAARAGHLAVVKHLVDAGAAVNQAHDAMGSPLQAAVVNGRTDVVRFLLERGASPNERNRFGDPVLGLAAARGSPAVLRVLLQAGADPNARSRDGWTPLMYAWGDDAEAVRVLVEYGARGAERSVDRKPIRAASAQGWPDKG
jgi:ankyrin repeat protein